MSRECAPKGIFFCTVKTTIDFALILVWNRVWISRELLECNVFVCLKHIVFRPPKFKENFPEDEKHSQKIALLPIAIKS